MHALVLMGLLLVGAKPAKPPVSLPMPPPPAAKPKPPDPAPPPAPAPEPAAAPAAAAVHETAPRERALIDRIQVSAAVGPSFSINGNVAVPGVSGSNPIWFRGVARGTFDLLKLGPGTLQALLPIALQGAGFRINVLGFVFEGSLFAVEVM